MAWPRNCSSLTYIAGFGSVPLEDISASIEDKHVARVEGLGRNLDLLDADVAAALDVEEACREGIAVDVLEASGDTTLQVLDSVLVEGEELVRLVTLDLAVLDRLAAKGLIQLDRLVRGHTHLILRCFCSQPEEDMTLQRVSLLLHIANCTHVSCQRTKMALRSVGM